MEGDHEPHCPTNETGQPHNTYEHQQPHPPPHGENATSSPSARISYRLLATEMRPELTSSPLITVRPATVEDAEPITDAHVRAWQQGYRGMIPDSYLDALDAERPNRIERRRVDIGSPDNPRVFNLAGEYDGDVVGWFAGGPSRDDDRHQSTGEVWAIYVHPEFWRTGVGGALMTAGLERLTLDGYTEATLWVLEANQRARGFYERFDWRTDGATNFFERDGHQVPEVRYRRPLP
jgi:ribosomal protein S18 acetylase RimI-like enzyme